MSKNIDLIESGLKLALEEKRKDWRTVGLLVHEVQENWYEHSFWGGKTYKSVTSWVKSFASTSGVPENTIWVALRAVRTLGEAYSRGYGERKPLGELLQDFPNVSQYALIALDRLWSVDPHDPSLDRLSREVLTGSVGAGSLKNIFDQKNLARNSARENGRLIGFLCEMDLSCLLAMEEDGRPLKYELLTDLPPKSPLSAIAVIPDQSAAPTFIGFTTSESGLAKSAGLQSCDSIYFVSEAGKPRVEVPSAIGHIEVNLTRGDYAVVKEPQGQDLSNAKKGRLGLAVVNRMVLGKNSLLAAT